MKRILEKFNTSETMLVVTSYLSREKGNFNAVSEYSGRTLSYLARGRKILVLSEKTGDNKPFLAGKNILVVPTWENGNIFSFISLFISILKLSSINNIYVQFEFNVFGGILPNLALLMILALLRLLGKRVTFELHQVITDVGKLAKHVYITNLILQKILNTGLKFYYIMLGFAANTIVVFERELKIRLDGYIDQKKIVQYYLPTSKKTVTAKETARRKLRLPKNKFLAMCFGFINGYKGFDWMVNNFRSFKNKNLGLVLAGGINPYLKDQLSYRNFYHSVINAAAKDKRIVQTGFVPENKVSTYYSAADLIIMPYEVFMSASGPFMLALAHNKPVILSEKLMDYAKSGDFAQSMAMAGISKEDLFFRLEKDSLEKLIYRVMNDKELRSRLAAFSRILSGKRNDENFRKCMDETIFPNVKLGMVCIPEPILVKS